MAAYLARSPLALTHQPAVRRGSTKRPSSTCPTPLRTANSLTGMAACFQLPDGQLLRTDRHLVVADVKKKMT